MNERRVCAERESLVSFLYRDGDEVERRRIERHVEVCASCAIELGELRSVQEHLVAWEPPDVELGFRLTRDPEPRSAWSTWHLPAWLQAAAAVFLVAGAAAVANLDVRYGAEGMVVRTGWSNPAPVTAADQGPAWRAELAAFEQRIRREISPSVSHPVEPSLVASTAAPPVATLQPGSQADLLRQVRELVEASARKQQQELALRMAQLARDVDVQRRADLLRIEQGFGQIEGQTGAAIAQQREWMSQLVRVSSQGR